jgi:integrase
LESVSWQKDAVFCGFSTEQVAEDFGHRTYNHYVQAIEQFGLWVYRTDRLSTNPIHGLARLNCETDIRRKRRALSQDEFARLVQSAIDSTELIQCFDGKTRTWIYLASYYTGLRRNELANLTPSNFNLDASQPIVTIPAQVSKHRKTDVLPLHPHFASMLPELFNGRDPNDLLFPKLGKRRTWRMVKRDLERAGIPYVTSEGVADFHAAGRHTYITELLRNGASLPEAQKLARHSDIKMVMRYGHIGIEDQAKAIARLPNPWQHIGSISSVPEGPRQASGGIDSQSLDKEAHDASSCGLSPSDTKGQKKTPPDKGGVLWRRRESNPRPVALPCPYLRA